MDRLATQRKKRPVRGACACPHSGLGDADFHAPDAGELGNGSVAWVERELAHERPGHDDVAGQTKDSLEKRFGANSAWILNPGAEGNLPPAATGADYMFMWTTILEGAKGLGEDFDFFYFVGPSAFGRFFGLDGTGDMEKIDAYFEQRLTTDPNLKKAVDEKKVSKRTFRDYYALRASVAFSYGSHDEWNIARIINERRRGADDFGIANQLSILFDGRAAAPGAAEAPIASGDVGRCIN